MTYKHIENCIKDELGDTFPITYKTKVALVMYFSELLALNFTEIDKILKTIGRDKILQIFQFESNFIEHIYTCLLNSKTKTILPDIYHHLVKMQELLHQREMLKSCNTSGLVQ